MPDVYVADASEKDEQKSLSSDFKHPTSNQEEAQDRSEGARNLTCDEEPQPHIFYLVQNPSSHLTQLCAGGRGAAQPHTASDVVPTS